jgi:branched-chain amino acid transport system permease protein
VKLVAFTISGAIAGVGGGLLVHLTQSFDLATYGVDQSMSVFTAAVVGGLGSPIGAILGAVYLRGTAWFVTAEEWRILSSAVGVLFVLLVLPAGLGGLYVRLRDRLVAFMVGCRPADVVLGLEPDGPPPTAADGAAAAGPVDASPEAVRAGTGDSSEPGELPVSIGDPA